MSEVFRETSCLRRSPPSGDWPFPTSVRKIAGRAASCWLRWSAIELSIVAITVILNQWYNRFYNTLQDHNWAAFVSAILFFCVLAAIYTVLAVYQNYLNLWLQIRWRRWMTQTYLRQWLNTANHYRMQLLGDAADNPDQRIADDLQMFVQNTLSIGIGLLNSCVTLVLVRRHSVDAFGAGAAASVRRLIRNSGLSGLGGAVLCHRSARR